jgi:hypothetical protein
MTLEGVRCRDEADGERGAVEEDTPDDAFDFGDARGAPPTATAGPFTAEGDVAGLEWNVAVLGCLRAVVFCIALSSLSSSRLSLSSSSAIF